MMNLTVEVFRQQVQAGRGERRRGALSEDLVAFAVKHVRAAQAGGRSLHAAAAAAELDLPNWHVMKDPRPRDAALQKIAEVRATQSKRLATTPRSAMRGPVVGRKNHYGPSHNAAQKWQLGEPIDVPTRSTSRAPPYWKSTVLRRRAGA